MIPVSFTAIYSTIVSMMISVVTLASSCVSVGSGDWANPGVWSCNPTGSIVECGRTQITVLVGHTITVTNQYNFMGCAEPMHLVIYGTLQFTNGNKLDLPCGSIVEVMVGGIVKKATPGGGNSTLIGICDVDWWIAGDGDQTGYQIWGAIPLPVELIEFSAELKSNVVHLNWVTASETNNDYFSVLKSNILNSWQLVTNVEGSGNASSMNQYSAIDENPGTGIIYYRLLQHDFNGTSEILATKAVSVKVTDWHVYPNPGNGVWWLTHNGNSNSVSCYLTDLNGRDISLQIENTGSTIQIEASAIRRGIYLLSVTDQTGAPLYKTRLVVQ